MFHHEIVDVPPLELDGALRGQLIESFVARELVRLSAASSIQPRPDHFRMTSGREVDVVLEAGHGRVVGLEVKSATSIDAADFRGLDALAGAAGPRLHRAVLPYGGAEVVPFGRGRWALPNSCLWA